MQDYQIDQIVYRLRSLASDQGARERQSFPAPHPGCKPATFSREEIEGDTAALRALIEQRMAD